MELVRPAAAAIVVFLAAAAVLILEIVAIRVMAPYVGVSLETYTGIIGTVLAGIAAGSWIGGRAADSMEPRRLLGPILIVGGLLALATGPLATVLGEQLQSSSLKAIVALSAATVFLPALVLSGVTPIVAKMQLQSLNATGRVVGRLSAIGTAGALVGTFGTGFFLTARFPTRAILAGVGAVLIATGLVLWWRLGRRVSPLAAAAVVIAVLGTGGAAVAVDGPCKVESAYFCIQVVGSHSDRLLVLDDLIHSYVDLRDPKKLAFPYSKVMAGVVDTLWTRPDPLNALHIGGGAFTLPRYLAATRPGSTNTVMEIDPAVVDTARRDFGVRTGPRLRVEVGDARLLLGDEKPRSYDLIIGDAFSGRSVPWQLTTEEFLDQLRGVLRPRGAYLMNLIDSRLRFVRAEAATLKRVFQHVLLFELERNNVLVASSVSIDEAALNKRLATTRGHVEPVSGAALNRLIGDARPLEDDFAPVDQLLR